MTATITQNGEIRVCQIELGQVVRIPSGYWARVSMFGCDDKEEDRLLVTLLSDIGITLAGAKEGVYPYELELKGEDFNKGELILNQNQ